MSVSSSSLPKLHQAVLDNDLQTVKRVLAEKLCDVEQLALLPYSKYDFLLTPMHFAAGAGNIPAAEALLSAGANVNSKDTLSWSPLHLASRFGHDKMVIWLIEHGADVLQKDQEGRTPPDIANEAGHTEIARLIQNNINNATSQREILLSQEVRSRTNSNASTVESVTSSQATIDQPYDMKKISYQGVAVIINNQDFSASGEMLSDRDGSQHDKDNLCANLRVLGLDIHCYEDLTADEMLNCLSHYSSLDHTQYTCFICCILTHGSEGKMYGVDGKSVTPLQVTSGFVAAKCASLKGKPKAFIIVACKGNGETEVDDSDPDIDTGDAIGTRPEPLTPPPSPETEPNESSQPPTPAEERLHEMDLLPLPEEDFLVAFSTIPGHISYRRPDFGTRYVKCLSRNLSKYGDERCLSEILRNTEKHLLDEIIFSGRHGVRMKQVCCKMDTLKQPFILSGEGVLPKYKNGLNRAQPAEQSTN